MDGGAMGEPAKQRNERERAPRLKTLERSPATEELEEDLARAEGEGMSSVPPPEPHPVPEWEEAQTEKKEKETTPPKVRRG
jgi:hypothetical protein